MESMNKNNVFTIVPRPKDDNIVDTKLTYRTKNPKTQFTSSRRRRHRTFTPVLKPTTSRLLFALAAGNHLHAHSFDAIPPNIDKTRRTIGYTDPRYPRKNQVLVFNKGLYGFKQSTRLWSNGVKTKPISIGFEESNAERIIIRPTRSPSRPHHPLPRTRHLSPRPSWPSLPHESPNATMTRNLQTGTSTVKSLAQLTFINLHPTRVCFCGLGTIAVFLESSMQHFQASKYVVCYLEGTLNRASVTSYPPTPWLLGFIPHNWPKSHSGYLQGLDRMAILNNLSPHSHQ